MMQGRSSARQLLEGLKKIASDKGFQISGNKGSGNCMFYALSEQLDLVKGIQISYEALRQHIVQYLKENPTLVSMVIQIQQSNKMGEVGVSFSSMPKWLTEKYTSIMNSS